MPRLKQLIKEELEKQGKSESVGDVMRKVAKDSELNEFIVYEEEGIQGLFYIKDKEDEVSKRIRYHASGIEKTAKKEHKEIKEKDNQYFKPKRKKKTKPKIRKLAEDFMKQHNLRVSYEDIVRIVDEVNDAEYESVLSGAIALGYFNVITRKRLKDDYNHLKPFEITVNGIKGIPEPYVNIYAKHVNLQRELRKD